MNPVNIPIVPNWNIISGFVSTPDDGFLYIGLKTINYIGKIEENKTPEMKIFCTSQRIKCLDVDPDWSDKKYFAALSNDNSIQICNLNDFTMEKGHKAHVKKGNRNDEEDSQEQVALCYLRSGKLLSIDSNNIVLYCVLSNKYIKGNRIIPTKYKISILSRVPSYKNIFAAGTTRGLILIVNLIEQKVLYTLRGHDAEITSFSFIKSSLLNKLTLSKSKRELSQDLSSTDDIFDIYKFDNEIVEFGAPIKSKITKSDDEYLEETNNEKKSIENENFDFVEACENLKEDIISLKLSEEPNKLISMCPNGKVEVSLNECQEVSKGNSNLYLSSNSNDSNKSFDTAITKNGEYIESNSNNENILEKSMNTSNDMEASEKLKPILLASGSQECTVWLWDVFNGAAVKRIQLINGPYTTNNKFTSVCFLNQNTIITNNRTGEILVWRMFIEDNKINTKLETRSINHRGVVSFCKLQSSDIIWSISSYRELVCENISTKQLIAKFSCASSNICQIKERPDDMNKIAIGFSDKRLGVLDISNMTPTLVHIENFSNKIESPILSICWCPGQRFIAFGTLEGRVGVIDSEKPQLAPVILKPFSGKPVYSLDWFDKYIFVCSNDKIAVYKWNGKMEDFVLLENIKEASCVKTIENDIFVGTQTGYIVFYKNLFKDLKFEEKQKLKLVARYISEISINPINNKLVAVSTATPQLFILTFIDDILTKKISFEHEKIAGFNYSVKWSNCNENLLLCCNSKGNVNIWDVSQKAKLICSKQYPCKMTYGLFSPLNENIVICAGKSTSIEMFEIKNTDNEEKYSCKKIYNNFKTQWGTELEQGETSITKRKKLNRNRKDKKDINMSIESISKEIKNLNLSEEKKSMTETQISTFVSDDVSTIFYLTEKELNKNSIAVLLSLLDNNPMDNVMCTKLFGNRKDTYDLLDAEVKNSTMSVSSSIGQILIPQIVGSLKENILEAIKLKKLTEFHLSLAPTISYEFWKNCCSIYADQLLDSDQPLRATPYLLACHKIKEGIEYLKRKKFHREALAIAKVHCEEDDPIIENIIEEWINFLYINGNFETAALICVLSVRYELGRDMLKKRDPMTDDIQKIIYCLNELCNKTITE